MSKKLREDSKRVFLTLLILLGGTILLVTSVEEYRYRKAKKELPSLRLINLEYSKSHIHFINGDLTLNSDLTLCRRAYGENKLWSKYVHPEKTAEIFREMSADAFREKYSNKILVLGHNLSSGFNTYNLVYATYVQDKVVVGDFKTQETSEAYKSYTFFEIFTTEPKSNLYVMCKP